jgi:LPS sulfotransferase NodH
MVRRLRQMFGHAAYTRFLLLTRSRTGSSMLMSFLRAHPQVEVYGEHFSRLDGRPYQEMLAEVFSPHPRQIKAVGFKIFYNQPFDEPESELWQALSARKDLRVLHLTRRNFLRTYVSRKIAEEQDVWSIRGAKVDARLEAPVFRVEPDELRSAYAKTRRLQESRLRLFADQQVLALTYEDLVSQPAAEFRRITDFLALAERPPQTTLKRQNTRKLSDIIINYAELRESMIGSELAAFFDDL